MPTKVEDSMQNAPQGPHENSHESAQGKFDSAHENVHESESGKGGWKTRGGGENIP